MKLFAWGDDLNVDIALIDRQHREYVRRTNAFLEASMNRQTRGPASANNTFRFLRKYIDEHFTTEEELMAETSYSEEGKHVAQHRHFQGEVDRFGDAVTSGELSTDSLLRLNYLLVDWFQRHIKQVDKRLSQHLTEKARASGNGKLRDFLKGIFD